MNPLLCKSLIFQNLFVSLRGAQECSSESSPGSHWVIFGEVAHYVLRSWGVLRFLLCHRRQLSHPGRETEQEIQMSTVTGILQEAIQLPQKCPWASSREAMPAPEEISFPWSGLLLPSLLRHRYPFTFPSPCSSHCVMQRFRDEKQQRMQQECRVIQ